MRRRVLPASDRAIAASLNNLAIIARKECRYDDAIKLYSEAEAVMTVCAGLCVLVDEDVTEKYAFGQVFSGIFFPWVSIHSHFSRSAV